MIAQFFKKSSLFAALLLFFTSLYSEHKTTHKIQVLIDPSDESFFFFGFNGSSLYDDPFGPRVAGGYYYLNGKIYPKDTINHNSTCFSTQAESIGEFVAIASLVADLSFDENFPVETFVEDVRWSFYFNNQCSGAANTIVAHGRVFSGEFVPNTIGFHAEGMPVRGTEFNEKRNFIKSANAYFNDFFSCIAGPQLLIEITFEEKIEYKIEN